MLQRVEGADLQIQLFRGLDLGVQGPLDVVDLPDVAEGFLQQSLKFLGVFSVRPLVGLFHCEMVGNSGFGFFIEQEARGFVRSESQLGFSRVLVYLRVIFPDLNCTLGTLPFSLGIAIEIRQRHFVLFDICLSLIRRS